MEAILLQTIIPFILTCFIVIIIMYIAENYGTKVGGILGTIPSTVVIAFIFIAINKDLEFASRSTAVVPAEIGANCIFLLLLVILANRSIILAFLTSLTAWAIISYIFIIVNLENIYISLVIYSVLLVFTFLYLERIKKIKSIPRVKVHYTLRKIIFRGVLAGIIISIAVVLSNIGTVISGIFSVFPAILSSTMIISIREYGPDFAAGLAKSMVVGISSVVTYVTVIHFLYPSYGIIYGTLVAYAISIVVTIIILKLRSKIQ